MQYTVYNFLKYIVYKIITSKLYDIYQMKSTYNIKIISFVLYYNNTPKKLSETIIIELN